MLTKTEIVRHLREGMASDIWYDALEYHDRERNDKLMQTMAAMEAAAEILGTPDDVPASEYRPGHQGYPDPVVIPAMYGGMKE